LKTYKYLETDNFKTESSDLTRVLNVFIKTFLKIEGVNVSKKTTQLSDFLKAFSENYYISKKEDGFIYHLGELYKILTDSENETALQKVFIDNDPNELFKYMKKNGISDIASAILQMP